MTKTFEKKISKNSQFQRKVGFTANKYNKTQIQATKSMNKPRSMFAADRDYVLALWVGSR